MLSLFSVLLQDVQRYIVMRMNMFGHGSGFNFQQLIEHYFHILGQWNDYKKDQGISADRVGGSAAYETLQKSWLEEIEDKVFTSFTFFREVRTFVNEALFLLWCRVFACSCCVIVAVTMLCVLLPCSHRSLSSCQARAVAMPLTVGGPEASRLDALVEWTKSFYDNKNGPPLETVVRNMCEADSVLRNHYKGIRTCSVATVSRSFCRSCCCSVT